MGVMNACITHRSNALTKTDGSAYNIQISTITPGAASSDQSEFKWETKTMCDRQADRDSQ